jgi:hypothetical protein
MRDNMSAAISSLNITPFYLDFFPALEDTMRRLFPLLMVQVFPFTHRRLVSSTAFWSIPHTRLFTTTDRNRDYPPSLSLLRFARSAYTDNTDLRLALQSSNKTIQRTTTPPVRVPYTGTLRYARNVGGGGLRLVTRKSSQVSVLT